MIKIINSNRNLLCTVMGVIYIIFSSSQAVAAVQCDGAIQSVSIEPTGAVWANYGYGIHRICVLGGTLDVYQDTGNTDPATITSDTCNALVASLTTAKAQGKVVTFHYKRTDCSIGSWIIPNPYPYFIDFP